VFETTADTAVLFSCPELIFITKHLSIFTNQVEKHFEHKEKVVCQAKIEVTSRQTQHEGDQ
jgi:hypothetical protein